MDRSNRGSGDSQGGAQVTIEVYSKHGCGICKSAKDKLDMMGLNYEVRDVEIYTQPHDGWRNDNSVDVLVAYTLNDHRLPLIQIDGKYHDYPSAMRCLKNVLREKRAAAAEN